MVAALLAVMLVSIDGSAAEPEKPQAAWVNVSDGTIRQLAADGRQIDWPGGTAGVVVDPSNGDVYMIVPGQGVWKSVDRAETFKRCDGGSVSGRCETAFSLNVDPAGNRLACFMLDGTGAWAGDGGRTWQKFTDVGRNWDFAAVDWSAAEVETIFAGLHESGGQVMFSADGGGTWMKLFHDPEFDKSGSLGVFDARTLVYSQKGQGIQRSTDAGKTWSRVSDLSPIGRVVRMLHGTAYWLGQEGLFVSTDQGATWRVQGSPVKASIGPLLDPQDKDRIVVAGVDGVFRSSDGGKTWTLIVKLPPGADIPKPGWYSNVAWDPIHDIFYVSKMGEPTYRFQAKR